MKLADHTTHYRRDAEEFDYFVERSGADLDAARRLQEAVLHAVPRKSPQFVLDIGSGSGWVLTALELRDGKSSRIVCADLGIASLRKLRNRFPGSMLVAADAERLPFRHDSFDVIVASEVLEHLNNPSCVLRQGLTVLASTGRFIASTPYREKLRYYLCVHCNKPTPVNAHLHSFDEHALTALYQESGYNDIRCDIFQNKAMLFLRISWVLRFLPWPLWRLIDRLCNFAVRKPHSIVITGDKPNTYDY
ncbi:MAG: class I SAM-dependent methyltransferase [Bacteroidota bacterium]